MLVDVYPQYAQVATVLTACGIETDGESPAGQVLYKVATVLTACGIETITIFVILVINNKCCNSTYRLRY